ncbi:uncharacterized protein ASPGLDRAFT_207367 [Aspergillus glaucus CBS 516.65]|uniref:Uncharacterized protein n=1 Tax=Aspergillus glaucus CBS 516.65 TaxID=1160497 RepID=A0A1L9VZ79_ASPGL|nr:hypothetical protein ASPGLDRAFT_207367 [Aspergillus glaucus CBS 516.65]OJJ89157.1 hypothetical protein ASPGLDRAFT_207367 [Aspergillus glaucus CBS 516.65]
MKSTTYMPYKAAARCSFLLSFTTHPWFVLFINTLRPYDFSPSIPSPSLFSHVQSRKMENHRLKTKHADDLFHRGTPDFNNLEIRSTWNGKVDEPADLQISLEVPSFSSSLLVSHLLTTSLAHTGQMHPEHAASHPKPPTVVYIFRQDVRSLYLR